MEEAYNAASMPVPIADPEAITGRFADLAAAQLVPLWRNWAQSSRFVADAEIAAFETYIDYLADLDASRTLQLLDALLREEPDDDIVALAADGKLLMRFLLLHAGAQADRVAALAERTPRWRWLLGGVIWMVGSALGDDPALVARYQGLADEPEWERWKARRIAGSTMPDFDSLSADQLAALWITSNDLPRVALQHDQTSMDLSDFLRELGEADADALIAVLSAIAGQTANPHLLGYLSAGPVEDLIGDATIDAIERASLRNPAFRALLHGVWTSGMSADVVARLERLVAAGSA